MEVSIEKSSRGCNLLMVDKFSFCKQELLKSGELRWRCSKKNSKCLAKVYTVGPEFIVTRSELVHNHEPDHRSLLRKIIATACNQKVQEEILEKPSKIIKSVLTTSLSQELIAKDIHFQPDNSEKIKNESDDQIIYPDAECFSRNPDEYLPENPSISGQTNEVSRKSLTKRQSGKVVCRMCLEPAVKNQMVPLTTWDVNYSGKSETYKQNKILQTKRVNSMINFVMPNFDFDIVYNPIICHKCVARLESAYNFIEGCKETEKMINLYKSKFAPNQELVSCEDVAQNKQSLEKEVSERKKRKTSKKSDSSTSANICQVELTSNVASAGDTSEVNFYESENVGCSVNQEIPSVGSISELMTVIKSEIEPKDDMKCGEGDKNLLLITTEDLTSVVVKEEVSVKDEVPSDVNDIPANNQINTDLPVKEEDFSLPATYATTSNYSNSTIVSSDNYISPTHRTVSRKRKGMDSST